MSELYAALAAIKYAQVFGEKTRREREERRKELSRIMPLVTVPHPALRTKSTPLVKFGRPMELMAQHMLDIVHEYRAVGLAANQVGVTLRLIVVHVKGFEPLVMANPEILRAWGELDTLEEGCLSEPGVKVRVPRHRKVRVRYQDSTGAWHTREATHLLARVIQHEIDHLDGKLIEDYLPRVNAEPAQNSE